jgi:BlaI family penicillinase repressor
MDVLWQKSPQVVREIVEQLAIRKHWHPSTSRTLLRRLVQKGAVKVHQGRRPFLYEPLVSRAECARLESKSLLQRVFGGKPVDMLVQLVEDTPLTPEDIERLKRLLSRKER